MTFQELVNEVVDRLHVGTSKDFARAGRAVNQRYKQVVSALGMEATVRAVVSASVANLDQSLTFTAEKLFSVWDPNVTQPAVLEEVTFDELRNQSVGTWPPSKYAIQTMNAATVTVLFNAVAAGAYTFKADAEVSMTSLTSIGTPVFASDFHDLLVNGALSTLLKTQGKYDQAATEEQLFQARLSELRYFIAKSAYLDITQGKTGPTTPTAPLV